MAYRIGQLALLVCLVALSATPVAARQLDMPVVYTGPGGLSVRSFDARWSSPDLLHAVHDELLSNTHGAEIAALERVDLLPGYGLAHYRARLVAGPDDRLGLAPGAHIVLYLGGVDDIDALAGLLAHEYGHHFTIYWFVERYGRHPSDYAGTTWAALRGLADDPRVGGGAHEWDPAEIMAEDYRQLFGSPRALGSPAFLLEPQENRHLPLAHEVPGLAAYWRAVAGLPPPATAAPASVQLELQQRREAAGGMRLQWWVSATGEQPLRLTLMRRHAAQQTPQPVGAADGPGLITHHHAPGDPVYYQLYVQDGAGRLVRSESVYLPVAAPAAAPPAGAPRSDLGMRLRAYIELLLQAVWLP